MLKLNILDVMFSGPSAGSNLNEPNPYIKWDRNHTNTHFVIVTDNSLSDPRISNFKIKVAWLIESPNPKTPFFYCLRKKIRFKKFKRVFTYDRRLIECGKKFTFSSLGGTWIKKSDWKIYSKISNLSILASTKKDLPGHQLRHKVINQFSNFIDARFGKSHRFVEYKLDALRDFRYSLIIENQRTDYYFTEKLIDCLATGTVPIYWGCPSIGDFFDMEGIIHFKYMDELKEILPTLSHDDYVRRLPAIKKNLETAKNFRLPEKDLHNGLLKNPDLMVHINN